MSHYKMVRDGQPNWCDRRGIPGTWRTAPDPLRSLRKKLGEELAEFTEYDDPGELYDLIDVAGELLHLLDPDKVALGAHLAKVRELGQFTSHLEWSPDPGERE